MVLCLHLGFGHKLRKESSIQITITFTKIPMSDWIDEADTVNDTTVSGYISACSALINKNLALIDNRGSNSEAGLCLVTLARINALLI